MEASRRKDKDAKSLGRSKEESLVEFVKQTINMLDKRVASEQPEAIHMYNRFQCILIIGTDPVRLRFLSYVFCQHLVLTRQDQEVHLLRHDFNSTLVQPESAFRLLEKYNFQDQHFLKCFKIVKLPSHDTFLEHLLSVNTEKNDLAPGTIVVDNLANWIKFLPPNGSETAGTQYLDEDVVDKKLRFVHLTCSALREAISYCGRIYSGEIAPLHRRAADSPQPISKKALLIVTLNLNDFFATLYPEGLPAGNEAKYERDQFINVLANDFFSDGCIDADSL